MAKGETRTQAQIDAYIASAKAKVDAKYPGNTITTETVARRLQNETGGARNGVWTDPGRNSAGATGMGQMFPPAVAEAHKLLYGETLKGDALKAKYKEITEDPEKCILYAYALYGQLEKQVRGYLKSHNIVVNDDSAIRTICSAAYHLGMGNFKGNSSTPAYEGVQSIITRANLPPFSISKFVELYEETTRAIHQPSSAIRKEAGMGGGESGGGPSTQSARETDVGPKDSDASKYSPLGFDVSQATPLVPPRVIEKGLDNLAWSDKDPTAGGGLVGNPHLRQIASPAWFELRLNRVNGDSLSDSKGNPLQFKLNVSLQSVNTKSEHIVHREPTATGLMITFWGSQPDSIVGRGTTGLFLNSTGLTSFMSTKGSYADNDLGAQLLLAFENSPKTLAKLLDGQEPLRVAAQDAFMEFTALFKNNGVIRFLPQWYQAANHTRGKDRSAFQDQQVWSPAAGATGFQMLNRAGDVYTRGHVAFKYKGQTYLGYFKSMEFTADAKTPFQWNFSFNFRVLRSLSPVFKYEEGG